MDTSTDFDVEKETRRILKMKLAELQQECEKRGLSVQARFGKLKNKLIKKDYIESLKAFLERERIARKPHTRHPREPDAIQTLDLKRKRSIGSDPPGDRALEASDEDRSQPSTVEGELAGRDPGSDGGDSDEEDQGDRPAKKLRLNAPTTHIGRGNEANETPNEITVEFFKTKNGRKPIQTIVWNRMNDGGVSLEDLGAALNIPSGHECRAVDVDNYGLFIVKGILKSDDVDDLLKGTVLRVTSVPAKRVRNRTR